MGWKRAETGDLGGVQAENGVSQKDRVFFRRVMVSWSPQELVMVTC